MRGLTSLERAWAQETRSMIIRADQSMNFHGFFQSLWYFWLKDFYNYFQIPGIPTLQPCLDCWEVLKSWQQSPVCWRAMKRVPAWGIWRENWGLLCGPHSTQKIEVWLQKNVAVLFCIRKVPKVWWWALGLQRLVAHSEIEPCFWNNTGLGHRVVAPRETNLFRKAFGLCVKAQFAWMWRDVVFVQHHHILVILTSLTLWKTDTILVSLFFLDHLSSKSTSHAFKETRQDTGALLRGRLAGKPRFLPVPCRRSSTGEPGPSLRHLGGKKFFVRKAGSS